MDVSLLAEIGDKEPTVLALWAIGVALTLICYLACSATKWSTALLLPMAVFWYVAGTGDIGPGDEWREAVVQELGRSYITHCYVTAGLPLFGVLVAWMLPLRLRGQHLKECSSPAAFAER